MNEAKIGFKSAISNAGNSVEIYKTDYFSGLCTADLTTKIISAKSEGRIAQTTNHLNGIRLVPIWSNNGKLSLKDLGETPPYCSLHGGVDMVVVTNDLKFCIGLQSQDALVSAGKRVPLQSGSMDWKDYDNLPQIHSVGLRDLVFSTAKRELEEEWGKEHRGGKPLSIRTIEFIGYYRVPSRGGKPQFVAFCKLNNNASELRADDTEVWEDERDNPHRPMNDLNDLREIVRSMLQKKSRYSMSIALFGSLTCLGQIIDGAPNAIVSVIKS